MPSNVAVRTPIVPKITDDFPSNHIHGSPSIVKSTPVLSTESKPAPLPSPPPTSSKSLLTPKEELPQPTDDPQDDEDAVSLSIVLIDAHPERDQSPGDANLRNSLSDNSFLTTFRAELRYRHGNIPADTRS